MRIFCKKQWCQYLNSIDWYDALDTQCRPQNLFAILMGIYIVESAFLYLGIFENFTSFLLASLFGTLGVLADLAAWSLRKRPQSFFVAIPTLIGIDALLYGLCVAFTALSIQTPYNYGMWCILFATLVYWGTVSGYSLFCTLFMTASPFICLLFKSKDPVEFAFYAFGVIMYIVISRNTGYRKTTESKRHRTEDFVKAMQGLLEKYNKHPKFTPDNSESFCLLEITPHVSGMACINFRNEIPNVAVLGNLEYLMFVLANLADNALDAGANCIDVHINQDIHGSIVIDVQDNGQGVSQEDISRLFNPFGFSKEDGVGMGLFLSRQLLLGFGGDLELLTSGSKTAFRVKLAKQT